jgi:tape measure domain-containing protein
MPGVQILRTMVVRINGDSKHYERAMQKVEKTASQAMRIVTKHVKDTEKKGVQAAKSVGKAWSDNVKKMGASAKIAGAAMSAGIGAGTGFVAAGMAKATAAAETARVQFETMLGRDKGRELIGTLREFSTVTPFQFANVTGAGRTLLGFGVAAKDVMGHIKTLGDISAGTGKDLQELSVIFGQIRGMGKLMGQDFLQLVNAGFPVAEIAKTMGVSMGQLRKEMEKGNVTFDKVQETFERITGPGGKFNSMMSKLSQTLAGKWSTFTDNLTKVGESFGDVLLPAMTGTLDAAIKLAGVASTLSKEMKALLLIIGGLAAVAGPAVVAFGVLSSLGIAGIAGSIAVVGGAAAVAAISVGFFAENLGKLITKLAGWEREGVDFSKTFTKAQGKAREIVEVRRILNKALADGNKELAKEAELMLEYHQKELKVLQEAEKVAKRKEALNQDGSFQKLLVEAIAAENALNPQKEILEKIKTIKEAIAKATDAEATEDARLLNILLEEQKKALEGIRVEKEKTAEAEAKRVAKAEEAAKKAAKKAATEKEAKLFKDVGLDFDSVHSFESEMQRIAEGAMTQEQRIQHTIKKRMEMLEKIKKLEAGGVSAVIAAKATKALTAEISKLEKELVDMAHEKALAKQREMKASAEAAAAFNQKMQDAFKEEDARRERFASARGEQVNPDLISISDTGAGIDPQLAEQRKGTNWLEKIHGELQRTNADKGGALFTGTQGLDMLSAGQTEMVT